MCFVCCVALLDAKEEVARFLRVMSNKEFLEQVAERVRDAAVAPRAAGDGSIRFRRVLEAAGIVVEADSSRAHVVRALHVCRLAQDVAGEPPEAVLPEYLRAPDAKPT